MSVYTQLNIRPCKPKTICRTVPADVGLLLRSEGRSKWHIYYKDVADEHGLLSEAFNTVESKVGTNWFARKNFLIRRPRVFRVICGASFPRLDGEFTAPDPTEFGPDHPFILAGDIFLHGWKASIPSPSDYGYLFTQHILNLLDSALAQYRVTPVLMKAPTSFLGGQLHTPAQIYTPKAEVDEYVGGEIYTLYLTLSQTKLQEFESWAHADVDQHMFNQGGSGRNFTGCPLIVIIIHSQLPDPENGDYWVPYGPLDNVAAGFDPPGSRAQDQDLLEDHMIESFSYKLELAIMDFTAVNWSFSEYCGPFFFPVINVCGFNDPAGLTRICVNWARWNDGEAAQDMAAANAGVSGALPNAGYTWELGVTQPFTGDTSPSAIADALIQKALDYFGGEQWP